MRLPRTEDCGKAVIADMLYCCKLVAGIISMGCDESCIVYANYVKRTVTCYEEQRVWS